MKPLTQDDIQSIQLGITDEIDRVCREHDITYFLAYGSVLGAIRHGGFIPWDDDMDVIMPREDYERFVTHFDEWTKNEYHAISFCRNNTSAFQFAKVVDTRTLIKARYVNEAYKLSVYVDIFPLDDMPRDKKKVFRRNKYLTYALSLALSDPSEGRTPFRRVVKKILYPLAKRMNPVTYACKIDENAHFCPKGPEDVYVDIVAAGDPELAQPKEWFVPLEVPFEDRHYFIPANYEAYLTMNYGDWRTPLPEKDRFTHASEAYWIVDDTEEADQTVTAADVTE